MNLRRLHNRDKWRVMVRLLLKLRSCFAGRRQKFRCFCSFRLLHDVYSAMPQDYSAFQFSFSNRDPITQLFGYWNYGKICFKAQLKTKIVQMHWQVVDITLKTLLSLPFSWPLPLTSYILCVTTCSGLELTSK